jgi:hypothetical protein
VKSKKAHPVSESHHIGNRRHSWLVALLLVTFIITLAISACVWLWQVEWLRPWLAGSGAALVALLGPIPGLLSPEARGKWLVLVGVAALIGVGTWYASKYEEGERDEARYDLLFSETLLKQIPADVQNELCRKEARPLQQLVLNHDYRGAMRRSAILRALSPDNGHALAFAGYAYQGLRDYGEMLTALKRYLHYADKNQGEAFSGDADACYARPSGYCGERTAWIENLLADYFFVRAQSLQGAEKIAALQQAATDIDYMLRVRKIGFDADKTVHDTVDMLQQVAAQLKTLGQSPDKCLALAAQVRDERRKAAANTGK